MHSIAHYAAAIILTSALGAFVLCLLVIRYGFTPAEDEPPPARHRRFFVTRLGHAAGAVCFAITAALAGVALGESARAPAGVAPVVSEPVDVAPLHAGQAQLAHDVRTLDERIERTEALLAELRAAAAAPPGRSVVDRAPRPARRSAPAVHGEARAVVRTPVALPSGEAEGDTAAAMPGTTTDFSAPAAPAEEPRPPLDARRPTDVVRSATDGMARLGTEIRKKAVAATRAVRDFFRDL